MKKENLKQNLPVIIAIALPVLLVVAIAILATLPSFGPKPAYDFIFTNTASRVNYASKNGCEVYSKYYAVEDYKLLEKNYVLNIFDKKDIADPCQGFEQSSEKEAPDLFLYTMITGQIQPVRFEQLANVTLKGNALSPDGFTVGKRFVDRGVIDLFGGNNAGIFYSKKNQHTKLDIGIYDETAYYSNDFNFIGWIEPNSVK